MIILTYAEKWLYTLNNYTRDPLHHFISSFTFIANNFGHQHNDPSAWCGDRVIGDFELIYIIDGQSDITIANKNFQCEQGDIILIPPFTKHKILTPSHNLHNNYWIHFDVEPFYRHEEFTNALTYNEDSIHSNNNHQYMVHIGNVPELLTLYELLEKELSHPQLGFKTFFNTILVQIVTLLLRYNLISSPTLFKLIETPICLTSNENNIIDKSIQYTYNNMSDNIRINDLCEYLHVSESYLFKSFSKLLKLPPNQFIQLIKIKHAEQLMKTTTLSIKEISDLIGFSSPYYFSHVFKKHYHVSPREYQRYMNT